MTGVKEAIAVLEVEFSRLALVFRMATTLRSVLTGVMASI